MEIKHGCDMPSCGKCLYSGCKDDNCPVHTLEAKYAWRKRMDRMGRMGTRNKKNRQLIKLKSPKSGANK
ncbi:MAG: hypothetical protein A3I26_00875 [Candidatus Yanofskybacteria bacterium RIFCSPLOWO2_02_FULL_43_10]|nr:MAG: hypothetical protein A3C69_01155 [Candidatus Yanofskybacteria bacterium RIFCSPHIGHO2_02_FULL_43_12]OGN29352.1 MAG: hypothetical protein A3I26_00875 [Candidatus Yanofskybacteria bacterium RIFCSPLOWO2_02_FULL_43_10]